MERRFEELQSKDSQCHVTAFVFGNFINKNESELDWVGGICSGYWWQLILRAGMYVCTGIVGLSGPLDHKRDPTVLPKHLSGGGWGAAHNAGSV